MTSELPTPTQVPDIVAGLERRILSELGPPGRGMTAGAAPDHGGLVAGAPEPPD